MNYIKEKEKEIEREINKMSIDELLYLKLNPNSYVYNKLKPQIEQIQAKNKEVLLKKEKLQQINKNIENKNISETDKLKEQIDKLYLNINNLLMQKENLNSKIPKNEFIRLLDNEIKKFDNPEACFSRLKSGKTDSKKFEKEFGNLGREKNYYYYKLIYDRIKND